MNRTTLNTIARTRNAINQANAVQDLDERLRPPSGVLMVIKNATLIAPNRWLYSMREAGFKDYGGTFTPFELQKGLYNATDNAGSGATDQTAINVWELMNTATTIFPGIQTANIPAGFSIGPVSGYVLCYPGYTGEVGNTDPEKDNVSSIWIFNAPNLIDGECA